MRSLDAVRELRRVLGPDVLVVAGCGRAAHTALTCWPGRTLLLDALGDVTGVAAGLATALAPRTAGPVTILSIEGDGSFLFGLESLATLATLRSRAARLTTVVLDNGKYESGGGLPSRRFRLDWNALIGAFGISQARAETVSELAPSLAAMGSPGILRIVVSDDKPLPPSNYERNGPESVQEFRTILSLEYGIRLESPARKY